MSAAADTVDLPPSTERKEMGDKFRAATKSAMPLNTIKIPDGIAPAPPPPPTPPKPQQPKPDSQPAPPPAPAPEPPKPSDAPAGELKGKAREAFDNLEKAMKLHKANEDKYKAELDKLQPQLTSLSTERDAMKAEVESLRKGSEEHKAAQARLKEVEEVISKFALEQDPRFHAHYNERRKTGVDIAKAIIPSEHAARLEQILALPASRVRDEQITALGGELDEFSRARLASAYFEIEKVEREKQYELARSSENIAKAREAEMKRQEMENAARQQQQKTLVDTVYQRIDPELEGVEDAPAFKEHMRRLVTGEIDQKGLIEAVAYAAKGHKYDKAVSERDEKISKLEAQVAELTASNPNVNGTGGSAPVRPDSSEPNMMGDGREAGNKFREAMNKRK